MTELFFGLILTLLALIGFFFNIYIVLALVLTKQVIFHFKKSLKLKLSYNRVFKKKENKVLCYKYY